MAGSYKHCVTPDGRLRDPEDLAGMLENGGDVWEAVEELYGMVWLLAEGDASMVENARQNYEQGIGMSPGVADES